MIKNLKQNLKKRLENEKIKLIIIGETHGFLEDSLIQEEIIKIFKPDIILYEMLEEARLISQDSRKRFLKEINEKDFSIISTFGELKKTVFLAKKYNIPIVGNDIKNMCRINKDFLKKTKLTNKEIKNEEKILFEREKKQTQEIIKYLKNEKKVIAISGVFHLREGSILTKLNINESYLKIYPTYEGKQLFAPPENFEMNKVSFDIKRISNNE